MSLQGHTVWFRADASSALGAGHVMRCLTLADELRQRRAQCRFICRELPGHLMTEIAARGYPAYPLPPSDDHDQQARARREDYDGAQSCEILSATRAKLLVVDHYDLGQRWESAVRPYTDRVAAIDDLADRGHDCDLLLDQNLGSSASRYAQLVPEGCRILAGPRFALLRPEFAEWREFSLNRRRQPALQRLFISMGGGDQSEVLTQILCAMQGCPFPSHGTLTVAVGQHSDWAQKLRTEAERLPWKTEIVVRPPAIAEMMANSDLAIGAAGGTAWERCCVGLPSLIIVAADNQRSGADALVTAGAAHDLGHPRDLAKSLPKAIESFSRRERLLEASRAAAQLVDGLGAERVRGHLEAIL